ncbi:uncharacterized protein QC763_0104760 [Podospora pseudopauciseta]|uniref:Uncharacterized protein n=2 Tax=Podospora TaxID=5144 RepID=A0ABR0H0Q0_9PEZI|nr:hypothetical protein QC763_0104760 [Podospora pseudopauciseta]KAK4668221.1 hypothetical protein QC764_0114190 [Podospora pseudoanserina]
MSHPVFHHRNGSRHSCHAVIGDLGEGLSVVEKKLGDLKPMTPSFGILRPSRTPGRRELKPQRRE